MVLLPALTGELVDRPDALRVGYDAMSWQELTTAAAVVAGQVAGAPAAAVQAGPTVETVVAVVGCLLAGVPAVPLPYDCGPLERAHILADSRADVLLTAASAAGAPPEDVPDRLVIPVQRRPRSAATASWPEPAGAATGLILYTSGTTGPPKGAVISRQSIAADLDALAQVWAWTPDDVLVHGLPLFHVHGLVLGVLGALRIGCRLVHTAKASPQRYAEASGSLYFGVPTIWSRISADPACARALSSARLLVSGSAPLPQPVHQRLYELTGHRAVERYGMTETLITVSTRADGDRVAGCVGEPVPGVATRLVDEAGQPVPHDGGTLGQLQVRGTTLFSGYLRQPAATAAAFTPDGWFRTGDIATIDAAGQHRIVGRASTDLIKSGGYRIGAAEVENALLAHPAVREAAVVGAPDADLGQQVVAYVVADDVAAPDLIDFVASQLSVHKRPRQVHLVDTLPRNAMGKVQKSLLTERQPAPQAPR